MKDVAKTTVYLPRSLKRAVARLAQQTGKSEAEVIRTALDQAVSRGEPPRPRLPLFSSDDPTLADRVDEVLEGFGA